MKIFIHQNGPFMVNTFLVINEASEKAVIVDPGHDVRPILEIIKKDNIKLDAIVATHGHIDHVEGVNNILEKFDADFYASELDKDLINSISVQAGMFGVNDPGKIIIDKNLPSQGSIKLADLNMELLHTPGHSKGSISIKIDDTVFSGDALFNMSIGRTDLPGGSTSLLLSSIKEKLFTLPDDTRVLPGHGPETTIGKEKKMNPFFR